MINKPLSVFLLYYFVKLYTSLFPWLSSVVCRSIGSALKDKCLTGVNQVRDSVIPSSEQDGSVMMSVTMEHLLLLPPPLMSSLCCNHSNSRSSGKMTSTVLSQRHAVVSTAPATSFVHNAIWCNKRTYVGSAARYLSTTTRDKSSMGTEELFHRQATTIADENLSTWRRQKKKISQWRSFVPPSWIKYDLHPQYARVIALHLVFLLVAFENIWCSHPLWRWCQTFPSQIEIFRWVWKTGSSHLICTLWTAPFKM